jgi:hypothetical protein
MTEANEEIGKKKMNLQDAIKKQLENKKMQNASGNSISNNAHSTKKMKSQQTKKVSNSRRKMGV